MLVADTLLQASLFAVPSYSLSSRFELKYSHFSKFARPIVYSKLDLEMQYVVFKRSLSSAVFIDKVQIRVSTNTDSRFFYCNFIDCHGKDGGAIEAHASVTIKNCLFQQCHAEYGGAVLCTSNFISNSSIYEEVSASDRFSVFMFEEDAFHTKMYTNSFSKCKSGNSAFVKFGSEFVIKHSNFTSLEAHSLAGFEVGRTAALIQFCNFAGMRARVRSCALSLWQCGNFLVTANFIGLRVGGKDPQTSVVCWCDGSAQTGTFSMCTVSDVSFRAGALIYGLTGERIEVVDCCFSTEESKVVNTEPFFSLRDNKYESECSVVNVVPQIRHTVAGSYHIRYTGKLELVFVLFSVFSGAFLVSSFLTVIRFWSL